MTNSARSSAARAAGDSPARPSSPMPMMVSQGAVVAMLDSALGIQRKRTHAHPHSGRHDGSLRARGASRRQLRLQPASVHGRPHQRPAPAADPDPHRRLRRRGGARPLPGAGADRGGGRRHASLRGRDVPQRGRGLRAGRRAAARPAPPAVEAAGWRPLDRRGFHGRGCSCVGGGTPPRLPHRGSSRTRVLRHCAAAHLSRAHHRAHRRCAAGAERDRHPRPRALRRSRRAQR